MQSIAAIVMSVFTFFGGLFGSIPHIILPWQTPSSMVEAPAEVVTIYQGIAAANGETTFDKAMRITEYPEIPGVSSAAVKSAVDLAFRLTDSTQQGVPGAPTALTANDLQSAKAENYHSGRTVVLTMTPKEQIDGFNGTANAGPVGHSIGVLGAAVQGPLEALSGLGLPLGVMSNAIKITYAQPKVTLKANAKTGKIITAEYSYRLVMEIPVPLIPIRVAASYSITKKVV